MSFLHRLIARFYANVSVMECFIIRIQQNDRSFFIQRLNRLSPIRFIYRLIMQFTQTFP